MQDYDKLYITKHHHMLFKQGNKIIVELILKIFVCIHIKMTVIYKSTQKYFLFSAIWIILNKVSSDISLIHSCWKPTT